MASDEARLAIHTPANCVFIHRHCHIYAEGGVGQLWTIARLISYEGYGNVLDFVHSMGDYLDDISLYVRKVDNAMMLLQEKLNEH